MTGLLTDSDHHRIDAAIDDLTEATQTRLEDGVTVHFELMPDGRNYVAAWVGQNSVGRVHENVRIAAERAVMGVRDMIDELP